MGKRLTRISGAQIRLSLPQMIDSEATVVLSNGSSFHGKITKLKTDHCILKDFRNYQHTFAVEHIAEIITDNVSSF